MKARIKQQSRLPGRNLKRNGPLKHDKPWNDRFHQGDEDLLSSRTLKQVGKKDTERKTRTLSHIGDCKTIT